MHLLKAMIISFSMYSRIPMPNVKWDSSSMRYAMCFFPIVGAIIGGVEVGWYFLSIALNLPILLFSVIATLIPVLITGGLHLDGFMDTHDALASLYDSGKRHEILKDPHSGAFAIIHCCIYFLITVGCYSYIYEEAGMKAIIVVAIGYFVSRIIAALCVVGIPCAKDSGLAYMFNQGAGKTAVAVSQILLLAISIGFLVWLLPITAILIVVAIAIEFVRFRFVVIKKFLGVSGDLIGYLLTRIEMIIAITSVIGILLKGVF